jgi:hypothetical protein
MRLRWVRVDCCVERVVLLVAFCDSVFFDIISVQRVELGEKEWCYDF